MHRDASGLLSGQLVIELSLIGSDVGANAIWAG